MKKFRQYLEDSHFILRTDSKTLTWLDRFKDTRDKLLRWALLLQEFNYTIEHCPGKENELPDLLSRNPVGPMEKNLEDIERICWRTTRTISSHTTACTATSHDGHRKY
ncbi:unnamed protein product [Trichogramma brassicae]|uniref:Reverse transcriptase RNase H-like domain-containing protein n=1 Tax=Trichogramma brassicae TaxID=86971 RepID=A0A6H5IWC6_9HYME|nr:unnamed protein product [Trichogramma brassicae]